MFQKRKRFFQEHVGRLCTAPNCLLRPGKALQSLQDSVDLKSRSCEPQQGWGLGRAIPALRCLWVCCLPWATHCLISKARPVAQSQLCPLPSGQAPGAQLDGGQHLQVCLSHRSADQGSAHWPQNGSSFQKRKASCLPLPESLLHDKTCPRLATWLHPHVVGQGGDKG